ncbi:uncharacterized protein [Epargyreus clarus]|uniref:uncharacterized protein n=1 Tax=Epargyreus clarus TaxID=520877 RepID=UPI003C3026B5
MPLVFRRLGNSLANHRASLSSELGSLWDFIRIDKGRRRSAPAGTYESIDTRSPVRLARDLLQVVQDTVFVKKFEDTPKRCPLVKEESDLTDSDEEEGTERRIANLIDFFFTIVKSQKEDRKGSGGSCFKSEASPTEEVETYIPTRVNTELEQKMETLIEFLATTGCMEKEDEGNKDEKKITLMEFLFGPEDKRWEKPIIEIKSQRGISLSESNVNVKNLSFIDETPVDEGNETLVEMLLKYMENYGSKEKFKETKSLTPSLSEKSKSDMTISKLETYSEFSKTKSDSTLTHTQETVIDRGEDTDKSTSRRISETVVDLSNIKTDLENIFEEAILRVCELNMMFEDDTMSDQEDIENFNAYTKPPQLQYMQSLPYSVELSDIIEEDEPSSRGMDRKMSQEDRVLYARHVAEDLLRYIEHKIQSYPFEEDSSGPSTEEYSREFDLSPSLRSISLVDLRNIPDLPASMVIKPRIIKVDKSTSTTEISDSFSDLSKRIDSACMTDDTSLTSTSERSERALDKLESLHRFFSRSRLEIIDESLEENGDKKSPKDPDSAISKSEHADLKAGQASLDDVEDLQEDNDKNDTDKSSEKKRNVKEERNDDTTQDITMTQDEQDVGNEKEFVT